MNTANSPATTITPMSHIPDIVIAEEASGLAAPKPRRGPAWPVIVALPPLIGMSVDSALISVALPAPLAPSTARTLPRGIEA